MEKNDEKIVKQLSDLIVDFEKYPKTREVNFTIMKLEEALMWYIRDIEKNYKKKVGEDMNAILYFDFGYKKKQGNKNVVKKPSEYYVYNGFYTAYGNIGEQITLDSTFIDYGNNGKIIVKYTNPDRKGNIITLSKKSSDQFFTTDTPQYNCALMLTSFLRLNIVFTKADNLNTNPQDKVVFEVEDINKDFSVSFDTNGDNYNVFLVFETLDIYTDDSGQFEDPPTCTTPYGYVTFNRFN